MPITNRDIRRVARQVFASTRAIVTPFYNRVQSRREVGELFRHRERLAGCTVVISAPMGTGKTFFIDQVAGQLGIHGRERPLIVRDVTERDLEREKGDVVFVDEGDIKTDWADLDKGTETIGQHLAESGRVGLVLGDFVLRNPVLIGNLPNPYFLKSFEPLDRAFLEGVMDQRVEEYLRARGGSGIIEPALYNVLVPDGLARVNSFRAVLSFLEGLADYLPKNHDPCHLTVDRAKGYVKDTFDVVITTDRQEEFLNRLLDFLAEYHPRGSGLESGLAKEQLFELGQRAGYQDWETFQDEVVEPFGEQGLLRSGGIPAIDGRGHFARWVEPYYPSLQLVLLAED